MLGSLFLIIILLKRKCVHQKLYFHHKLMKLEE